MADKTFLEALADRIDAGYIIDGKEVLGFSTEADDDYGIRLDEINNYVKGTTVLTVGPKGQYATIAEAVSAIGGNGTPIDLTPPGTTLSINGVSTNYYLNFSGSDMSQTELRGYPRWIKPQGTAAAIPHLALSNEITGTTNSISALSNSWDYLQSAVTDQPYDLVDMPKVAIDLDANVTHVIDSEIQLPEYWNLSIRGIGGQANIHIKTGGMLRVMDVGRFETNRVEFLCGVNDGLNITNKAASQYAPSSLFVNMFSTSIKSYASTPGASGVLTAQQIKIDAASVVWVGSLYSVTPEPATLVAFRFTASEVMGMLEVNSDQDAGNRHIGCEFSFYYETHRPTVQKTLTVRSSVVSTTIHMAMRDRTTDNYVANQVQGKGMSVMFANSGRVVAHGCGSVTSLGGEVASYMEDGATNCSVMTNRAVIESNSLFTGKPFANVILTGGSNQAFYNNGANALEPLACHHRVGLINSSVVVTAIPSIDMSSFINGQRLILSVSDAGGDTGNSITLQDESILPGSNVYTKTGLATPGQLVIATGDQVEFVYIDGKILQLTDVMSLATNPN